MWIAFFKMMFALLIVIFLLIATLKITQKYSNVSGGKKNMKLVDQLRLSPKSSVSIVKVGGSYLVLGCNEESITLLKELSETEILALNLSTETPNMTIEKAPPFNFKTVKEQWRK